MEKNKTILKIEKLVKKIAEDLNYEIWDIRFLKEGASWYLRIFIDSEKGITIDDCEKMSRAIDKPLDQLDPISVPYCLEVCSPGLERELIKNHHFKKFINQNIVIRLFKSLENNGKEIHGKLIDYNDSIITIKDKNNNVFNIAKKDTAFVKADDFNLE